MKIIWLWNYRESFWCSDIVTIQYFFKSTFLVVYHIARIQKCGLNISTLGIKLIFIIIIILRAKL